MEFKEGQRVKVEYEGEIVAIHDAVAKGRMVVKAGGKNVWVNPNVAKVTVLDPAARRVRFPWSRRRPKGRRPAIQPGDVWETPDGQQWHAQVGPGGILLRQVWTEDRFMTLKPRLIRRA